MADQEGRSLTKADHYKVLTIGCTILIGIIIIAVTWRSWGSSEDGEAQSAAEEEAAQAASPESGSYLDRPPRDPDTSGSPMSPYFTGATDGSESQPPTGALTQAPPDGEEIMASFGNSQGSADNRYNGYQARSSQSGSVFAQSDQYGSARSQEPELSPREQAYQEAKTTGLSGNSSGNSGSQSSAPQAAPEQSGSTTQDPYNPEAVAQRVAAAREAMGGQGPPGIASQQTGQAATQASGGEGSGFQSRLSDQQSALAYQAQVQQAPGRYRVPAGTKVEAALADEINSNLPGTITAQITRDVLDQNNHRVLIPGGSTLIGTYDDAIAGGQNRLMVAWTRIQMAGGKTIVLPGLQSAGITGKAGLGGDVDNHYGRIFGGAVAMSAIGAGFQLTQDNSGGGYGGGQTPQQVVGAEVGREFSRVAAQMLRKNMNISPTINIERGKRFTVVFGKDLVFDEPYEAPEEVMRFRAPRRQNASTYQADVQP